MKREDYYYGSMRIRIFEKSLVQPQTFQRMIEADGLEEALHILGETRYGDRVRQLDQPENFEEILSDEWQYQLNKVGEIAKYPELERLFSLSYEYHNLKVLIKDVVDGTNHEDLYYKTDSLDMEKAREFVEDPTSNPQLTSQERAIAKGQRAYRENQDAQELDFILDRTYFEDLEELTAEMPAEVFQDYIRDSADFNNLLIVMRARRQDQPFTLVEEAFLPGGQIDVSEFRSIYRSDAAELAKEIGRTNASESLKAATARWAENQDLAELERALDNHLLTLADQAGQSLYGPEVLFSYIMRVQTEIQNLRIILNGQALKVSEEAMKERMRVSNA